MYGDVFDGIFYVTDWLLYRIESKNVSELMVTLSVTMAPNVKEILDMAESIGNKETTSFLSNCLEGKHANVASIKTKLCSLQAEEKRLRRLGPKGKEKLENLFCGSNILE